MKKGEIWIADMPDGVGHEQKGIRPMLVMAHANELTLAVPLTTNLARLTLDYTCEVSPSKESGLDQPSVALVFQLRSLDDERFKKKLGFLTKEERQPIDELLKGLLKLHAPGNNA